MDKAQNSVLRLIYTLVLAVAFGLFIGVSIYTFYPYPSYDDIYKQDVYAETCSDKYDYDTSAYKKCQKEEDLARQKKYDEREDLVKSWTTNVGVFLLIVSSIVIFASVYLNEKIEIISNGLLLGGFFTMLSSVGFSFGSGNKYLSFAFSLIALGITIFVGYIRLTSRKKDLNSMPGYQQPVQPVQFVQNTPIEPQAQSIPPQNDGTIQNDQSSQN
jgi:hypothetical protein